MESRLAVRMMLDCLSAGEGLVIFPEGTYVQGRVGPGHVGLIRMIRSRMAVPLIPVGVSYAGKGRKRVRIRFGRPLSEEPWTSPENLLDRIMKEMARLSGL